ncbi:MAG: cyclopropane-fatty-acyl-phospholipid synthase family protein [Crocinitomicaceae bacterium]
MKNLTIKLNPSIEDLRTGTEKIIDFYQEATEDYEHWSQNMNMHFGYFKLFQTNPFKRDTMLEAMNGFLFSQLDIKDQPKHIADLGCGMGATIKYGTTHYPNLSITGFTVSPFQVMHGNKHAQTERSTILHRNYKDTKCEDGSFDGAIAIESFSHSGCDFIALEESYRILKPEAKIVISDAFTKKPYQQMSSLSKYVYDGLCKSWALSSLGNINKVVEDMKAIGYKNIEVKNIWYRVAPSVLHVPVATSSFVIKKKWQGKTLKKESINNLKGSVYALLTGFCLRNFGYYVITANK